jgi:hypothetical protein
MRATAGSDHPFASCDSPLAPQYGKALEFVSEELKDDEEVCVAAVRNDWEALQFASQRLRSLPSLMDLAIELQARLTLKSAGLG